jgi:hypothetical protein
MAQALDHQHDPGLPSLLALVPTHHALRPPNPISHFNHAILRLWSVYILELRLPPPVPPLQVSVERFLEDSRPLFIFHCSAIWVVWCRVRPSIPTSRLTAIYIVEVGIRSSVSRSCVLDGDIPDTHPTPETTLGESP